MQTHRDGIVDVEELVNDLRRGVGYATRAGLLHDNSLLDVAKCWEDTEGRSQADTYALVAARNRLSQLIAPITFTDLSGGRNPFDEANQKIGKRLQFILTIAALVVLMLIGFYMHAVQREQAAILTLQDIQSLRPLEKLHSLRKMAQWENPLASPTTLYDEYHQRASELHAIKERIENVYLQAVEAVAIPLFPFERWLQPSAGSPPVPPDTGAVVKAAAPAKPEKGEPVQVAVMSVSAGAGADSKSAVPVQPAADVVNLPDVCRTDPSGRIQLAGEAAGYPEWMKMALLDSMNDFCFQVRVLSPGGDGALLNENFSPLNFIGPLKDKASFRTEWFLPFLYGLLGSIVFLIRNIANVRTPAMDWLPALMRIALGGVAGIVVGWFSSTTASSLQGASSLSIPFMLAFLTGYGIDILFTMLDRISQLVEQAAGHKAHA